MRTTYKNYTVITETSQTTPGGWALTLEIIDADGVRVIAPLSLGPDLVFATDALAHRAGVLLARYWIDGGRETR